MSKPIVFISYSHDSEAHKELVLSLSERLRSGGIETRLDQYVTGSPVETWPRWMLNQLLQEHFAANFMDCERLAGRLYPYAGEFDPKNSNVNETDISQTRAVGIFPNGASPFGVEEMSGNVLEWCLGSYDKPQIDAQKENLRKVDRRVLRGGSWFNYQLFTRAVCRLNNGAGFRNYYSGFRVVVLRPPSS